MLKNSFLTPWDRPQVAVIKCCNLQPNQNVMSFNLIRSVNVIIVSITLSACFHGETDWEVSYGWTSGWGNGPMYKINSKGRLELIKPYPDDENKM
jgi:hypothetical protein